MTLKYNRKGFLPGVPARDLTDDEVEKYGGAEFLISRGIYERERQAPATPIERPKRETKKVDWKQLTKDG